MKNTLVAILAVLAAARMAAHGAEQGVTLSFSNAPLEAIAETYHDLTGKTMLVSPSVPRVTLTLATQGLTKENALLALETLLYENGIGIVAKKENLLLVCPITVAGQFVPHLITEAKEIPDRDYVVSYRVPIEHLDPGVMAQTLGAFTSAGPCQVTLVPSARAAIITGPASLVKSLAEIARSIDVPRESPQASEVTGTPSQSRHADNIQVDFRITFRTGAGETNCTVSICTRDGQEISAKDVTDVPCIENLDDERGTNKVIVVGTLICVTARIPEGGDGLEVSTRMEMTDIVSTNAGGAPAVSTSTVEFNTIHKDAAFVKVWAADPLGSQASRLAAIYVRAVRKADAPRSERPMEKVRP